MHLKWPKCFTTDWFDWSIDIESEHYCVQEENIRLRANVEELHQK